MLSQNDQSSMPAGSSPQSRPICIIVKEDDRTLGDFWTTSELLYSASPYFKVMLMGSFCEAATSHVIIDHHPVWIVEAFLNFVKFGRLTSDEDHDHSDLFYRQLFQLYQFADFYQVRGLRNLIVESVQKKLHYHISPHDRLSTLTQDDFPSVKEFNYLCENLPESSPLRKVIADAVVNFNAQFSPIRVTARLTSAPAGGIIVVPEVFKQDCDAARSRQAQVVMCSNCAQGSPCDNHSPLESHRYRFSSKALCLYHEHDTEQEQAECQKRMASVIEGRWMTIASVLALASRLSIWCESASGQLACAHPHIAQLRVLEFRDHFVICIGRYAQAGLLKTLAFYSLCEFHSRTRLTIKHITTRSNRSKDSTLFTHFSLAGSRLRTLSIMAQDSTTAPAAPLISAMAQLNILDLAQPIDLEVETNNGQVLRFSAMRSYLCAYSRYFRVLFEGPWADSGKRTVKIDDLEFIHPWVVPCVIAWMYTQKLSLRGISGTFLDCIADGVDLDDFTTWSYCMLWALYGFADRYEIKTLRTIVIRQVQVKMLRCRSGSEYPYTVDWSHLPTVADLETLINEIPISESPLRKAIAYLWRELETTSKREDRPRENACKKVSSFWLTDMYTVGHLWSEVYHCDNCSFGTHWRHYPLPEGYQRSCPLHSEADFVNFNEGNAPRTWCIKFHEHDTQAEALSCQNFMEIQTGISAPSSRTDSAKKIAEISSKYPDSGFL